MWGGEIDRRVNRDDLMRVHRGLTEMVLPNNVIEMHGLGDISVLIKLPRIGPKVRVIGKALMVALEMGVIHEVKAREGREQPPVGLGQLVAREKTVVFEDALEPRQTVKKRMNRVVIGILRRREPGFIDAIVNGLVNAFVDVGDLFAQVSRPIIISIAGDFIKRTVEHANDLGRFVRYDRVLRLVPKHRHRDAASEIWIGFDINVTQKVTAKEGVSGRAFEICCESPAVFHHIGVYDRHADMVGKVFQRAENQCAMCPRAGIADVEVIPP